MEEFYIDSDGIKLHAKLQLPEGKEKCPLVIVVHGLTGHMEEDHIKAAADTFCELGCAALRVEMYGHGKSEGLFEDHNLLKWANNLLDVVRYVKSLKFVTDIYLCGHSQGGLLTVMGGGLLPDVFKAIIPMSPAINIPDMIRKGYFFAGKIDFDNMPDYVEVPGRRFNTNYFRVARLINVDDFIDKYHKPVLVIHGDNDLAVPIEYGRQCAQSYEKGVLKVIKNADHCYVGHLEELKQIIRDFMKEVL